MARRRSPCRSVILAVAAASLGPAGAGAGEGASEERKMALTVTSPAFKDGAAIPSPHTCDGEDASPPLAWTAAPDGTKSLALIADDPDAPGTTWVHWVVYNIPPTARGLPEAVPPDRQLPDGMRQGVTDFGRIGYGGPCPPSGTHRYVFTLYALDGSLALAPGATKAQLEEAMKGRTLSQGQLIGTYRRRGR